MKTKKAILFLLILNFSVGVFLKLNNLSDVTNFMIIYVEIGFSAYFLIKLHYYDLLYHNFDKTKSLIKNSDLFIERFPKTIKEEWDNLTSDKRMFLLKRYVFYTPIAEELPALWIVYLIIITFSIIIETVRYIANKFFKIFLK